LKFDILTEQNNKVIAEDNNENNCEIFELKSRELKRSSSNKLIDSFMDKSENDLLTSAKKQIQENIIETIKEENIEEEEISNIHTAFNCDILISDELKDQKSFKRYSIKAAFEENKINELDDELEK